MRTEKRGRARDGLAPALQQTLRAASSEPEGRAVYANQCVGGRGMSQAGHSTNGGGEGVRADSGAVADNYFSLTSGGKIFHLPRANGTCRVRMR